MSTRWSRLRLRNWSITAKLSAALLLAALLPMSFIAYYNLQEGLDSVEQAEYDTLELLARSTAQLLDQVMDDNQIAAAQIAGNSEVIRLLSQVNPLAATGALSDSVAATLEKTLSSNPKYEYVYLMDRAGNTVISRQLPSVPSIQGRSFADRAYFQQPMTGRPYIDVLVGRSSRQLGFYFSTPVYAEAPGPDRPRPIIGVAIIKVLGSALTDIVNNFRAGETGYAFLVDQDGVIVSHPRQEWYYRSFGPLNSETQIRAGKRFVLPGCDGADLSGCKIENLNIPELAGSLVSAKGVSHTAYELPDDGAPQIVGFAPTRQLGWVVGVNESAEEFAAPLNQLARNSWLSLLVVAPLVVLLALRLARGIARPIGKLASAAQDVESDRPFEPAQLASVTSQGDEVGHLARVFSAMVLALRARMAELQTIYEVGSKITSSVELQDTLDYILNSLNGIIPYDVAEISLYDQSRQAMVTHASAGLRGPAASAALRHSHDLSNGYFSQLVAERSSVLIPDIERDEQHRPGERAWHAVSPRSYLGVPLKAKDQVIGTIELVSKQPNGFTPDNLRILESIAIQASVAVQNAQQVQMRESKLKQEIQELRIEIDEAKRARQVEEITGTDYFQSLRQKVADLRSRSNRNAEARGEQPPFGDALANVETRTPDQPEAP